jgi:hypothetical protein
MAFRVLIACDVEGCEATALLSPSGNGGPGRWEAEPFTGESTSPPQGWIDDVWIAPDGWLVVRAGARCPAHG